MGTDTHNNYTNSGFSIFGLDKSLLETIESIKNEINECAALFDVAQPFNSTQKELKAISKEKQSNFYRCLRYLPSLNRLACHPSLLKHSNQLGIKHPLVMNASNIRMDVGGDNSHQFHWHQDYTYLLGSANSITYWIPMQDVSPELGTISIIPESHKQGVFDYKVMNEEAYCKSSNLSPKDLALKFEPNSIGDLVTMKFGQGLVFSQFLLHRTVPHKANHTRWTIQIRHSDASDPAFQLLNIPLGDSTTIIRNPNIQKEL